MPAGHGRAAGKKRCTARCNPPAQASSDDEAAGGGAAQLARQQPEAFEGNAVMWALKKADESLDEIEENPPEFAKAIYDFSRGAVGEPAVCSSCGRAGLWGGALRAPPATGCAATLLPPGAGDLPPPTRPPGRAGTAASKGVATAAKVSLQVGGEVVKAAAPVGKWVLQQGFKLAVTAVSKGIEAGLSSGKDEKGKKK